MTDQRKRLIKMVLTMVYIVLLPIAFFAYIGEDPTRETDQATRQIAIVNEDTGASEEGLSLRFGEEVSSLINENSSYSWTMVGRGAAESGLANQQYDAILYVPSDFSTQVLNFKDNSPSKASIEFTLQTQLNAKDRERAQRELEMAQNRINEEMSTLYWSYVAQEIDYVKEAFSDILDKEIAFQDAINSFYSGGSQTLAEDIASQREQLDALKETIEEGSQGTEERLATVEEAEQFLTGFVEDINAYRDYQLEQQALLAETQLESQRIIQESSTDIQSTRDGMMAFADQVATLNDIDAIQQQVTATTELTRELGSKMEGEAGETLGELLNIQAATLSRYKQDLLRTNLDDVEGRLLPLRNAVVEGPPEPEPEPDPDPDPTPEPGPGEPIEFPAPELDPLTEERELLAGTSEQVAVLSENVTNAQTLLTPELTEQLPQLSDIVTALEGVNESLGGVSSSLGTVDAGLAEKQSSDAEWLAQYAALLEAINGLPEEPVEEEPDEEPVEEGPSTADQVKGMIASMEAELLNSDALSSSRKATLRSSFEQAMGSVDGAALAQYAEALGQYGQIVNELEKESDPVAESIIDADALRNAYFNLLEVGDEERAALSAIIDSANSTGTAAEEFSSQTEELTASYTSLVEEQQGLILEEIDTILSSSQSLSESISATRETEAIPAADTVSNPGEAVNYQQQVATELTSLNRLVESLQERQSGVIDYSTELQEEVNRVQAESVRLNESWEENVLFTQNIQEDLDEIFTNATVDGQSNGYVYDFLSNPVDLSGEVLEERTVQLPPVVMLVILLVSGLLIGFFTQYFKLSPWFVQLALFSLLNLVVGLIVSIFGLTIYPLGNEQAIMWSVYTVMLLLAISGTVFVAFNIGVIAGWIVSVLLMLIFVTPLLDLILPSFEVSDPITNVFLSIQYGTQQLFVPAVTVLGAYLLVIGLVPVVQKRMKAKGEAESEA